MKGKFMLILLLPGLFFSSLVFAQGVNLDFSVPVPAQTELADTHDMVFGERDIHCLLYVSKQDPEEIKQFYEDFFHRQEFIKTKDESVQRKNKTLLRYKKEDLVVNVTLIPQGEKTQIIIAKYLQPPGSPEIEETKPSFKDSLFALPKEDQPGRDLSFIPRPPGSIRMGNLNIDRSLNLIYNTPESVRDLRNFYKQQMPYHGWELTEEQAVGPAIEKYKEVSGKKDLGIKFPVSGGEDLEEVFAATYILRFSGSRGEATIVLFPNFIDKKSGSMVRITYEKTR